MSDMRRTKKHAKRATGSEAHTPPSPFPPPYPFPGYAEAARKCKAFDEYTKTHRQGL